MAENRTEATQNRQPEQAENPSGQITPQLVRKVADKVYALLLADLRIGRERKRKL